MTPPPPRSLASRSLGATPGFERPAEEKAERASVVVPAPPATQPPRRGLRERWKQLRKVPTAAGRLPWVRSGSTVPKRPPTPRKTQSLLCPSKPRQFLSCYFVKLIIPTFKFSQEKNVINKLFSRHTSAWRRRILIVVSFLQTKESILNFQLLSRKS